MDYNKLLKEKGFSLNTYSEGKFWELVVSEDESKKDHICKIFGFDSSIIDIDTLILQCSETFTKCTFYYDCNPFEIESDAFMQCVKNM